MRQADAPLPVITIDLDRQHGLSGRKIDCFTKDDVPRPDMRQREFPVSNQQPQFDIRGGGVGTIHVGNCTAAGKGPRTRETPPSGAIDLKCPVRPCYSFWPPLQLSTGLVFPLAADPGSGVALNTPAAGEYRAAPVPKLFHNPSHNPAER